MGEALADSLVKTSWLSNEAAVEARCVISYMFLARQLQWGEDGDEGKPMSPDDAEALWNTINPLILLNIKQQVVHFCEGLAMGLPVRRFLTDGEKFIIKNLLKDDFLNEFYRTKFIEMLSENKFDSLGDTLNEYHKTSDIVCKECHGRCKVIADAPALSAFNKQFDKLFPPPQRQSRGRTRSAPTAQTTARDSTSNPFGKHKVSCPACNGSGFSGNFRARINKCIGAFVKYEDTKSCPTCEKSAEDTLKRLTGSNVSIPTGDCQTCWDTGIDRRHFGEDVHTR